MVLPLPSILNSIVEGFDSETRDNLKLFELLVARLENGLKTRLTFDKTHSLEFPQLVVSYLIGSLQRIRLTSWGMITSINANNDVLLAMSVRTMLESAANTAYLWKNLTKTYAGQLDRKEMTYLSMRMKFATRHVEDWDLSAEEEAKVTAVNVLTTIKALGFYAERNLGFPDDHFITKWYARLCEYSHPNSLGSGLGSEPDCETGFEIFEIEPALHRALLPLFSNYAYVSLYSFCGLFNECFSLLIDAQEILPQWEPAGKPFLDIG